MVDQGWKTYHLHPGQTRAIKSQSRFLALVAGTGGGKTYLGPIWLYHEISRFYTSDELWMVVAPTYPILQRATVPALLQCLQGTELQGTYREHDHQYHLPNGSIIWTLSADNPLGLEGGQFRGIWMDEAGQMKRDAWVAVQGRLGVKLGRALITTTPYGRNWLFSEFFNFWQEGDPDYFVSQFASIENPAYPEEEFERVRRTMDPRTFARRYLGQFVQLEGLVYPEWENCLIPHRDLPPEWPRFGGIDWGFANPLGAVVGALSPDDVLYIYWTRKAPHCTLKTHAEAFLAMDVQVWYPDPEGAQEIFEVQTLGVPIGTTNNDVAVGIDQVTQRILSGRLKIMSSLPDLRDEISTYQYRQSQEGKNIREEPVKANDHLVDALRYLVSGISLHQGGGSRLWVATGPSEQVARLKKAEQPKYRTFTLQEGEIFVSGKE